MATYRFPYCLLGVWMLLGVVAVDLIFDMTADDSALAGYYRTHRLATSLPAAAFVPVGILLAAVPIITSAVRDGGTANLLSAAVFPVLLYVFVAILIPTQELVIKSSDAAVVATVRETCFFWHCVLGAAMLGITALQVQAHAVEGKRKTG